MKTENLETSEGLNKLYTEIVWSKKQPGKWTIFGAIFGILVVLYFKLFHESPCGCEMEVGSQIVLTIFCIGVMSIVGGGIGSTIKDGVTERGKTKKITNISQLTATLGKLPGEMYCQEKTIQALKNRLKKEEKRLLLLQSLSEEGKGLLPKSLQTENIAGSDDATE